MSSSCDDYLIIYKNINYFFETIQFFSEFFFLMIDNFSINILFVTRYLLCIPFYFNLKLSKTFHFIYTYRHFKKASLFTF